MHPRKKDGLISKLPKSTVRVVIKAMGRIGFVAPMVCLYAWVIREFLPPAGVSNRGKPRILALTPERFRGDLEALAASGEFQVLSVPYAWQIRVVNLFWNGKKPDRKTYTDPRNNGDLANMQKNLRTFLRSFLSSLCERLKISCVISAGIHYLHDYEWGSVCNGLGVPFVVFHRENLAVNVKNRERWYNYAKEMKKFKGAHVIVHNETMKSLFVEAGFVDPAHVSALGVLRMDDLSKRIRLGFGKQPAQRKRKKVTFFSFTYRTALARRGSPFPEDDDFGYRKLFEHTHVAIARLAEKRDDVDFVIKPKFGGNWVKEIDKILGKNGIERGRIPNMTVTWDVNAQDLILDSDVVCGFNSTTLLEAGIAGKAIVVPHFDEALREEYSDYIVLKDYYHLFDVAHSPEEFEGLIMERLSHPEVTKDCIEGRYRLFEKYVSSLDGNALDRYVDILKRVIRENAT